MFNACWWESSSGSERHSRRMPQAYSFGQPNPTRAASENSSQMSGELNRKQLEAFVCDWMANMDPVSIKSAHCWIVFTRYLILFTTELCSTLSYCAHYWIGFTAELCTLSKLAHCWIVHIAELAIRIPYHSQVLSTLPAVRTNPYNHARTLHVRQISVGQLGMNLHTWCWC